MTAWKKLEDIRAAFFDVDGTLVSLEQNCEPESTKEALRRLRANGIMPFLSTGRPKYTLQPLDLGGFVAFVTINGQYCYTRERVLYKNPLNGHDVATVVGQVRQGLYPALFQEAERCYASDHSSRVRDMEHFANQSYPEGDLQWVLDGDVYQINAYVYPGEEQQILDATDDLKVTRWTDKFVDVMPKHGGKSLGVLRMFDLFGLRPEETICFGDGENDLGMFGVCGTSVAMGNAYDLVKRHADHVTDDVDHDGIYNACVRLGLI